MNRIVSRAVSRSMGGIRRFGTEADNVVAQKKFNPEFSGPKGGVGEKAPLGNFGKIVYNNIMKSVPMYGTTILGLAIFGDLVFDNITGGIWEMCNRGKLFDDVIPVRFPNMPPGTEDDEDEDE
jgi:hypothetical protein